MYFHIWQYTNEKTRKILKRCVPAATLFFLVKRHLTFSGIFSVLALGMKGKNSMETLAAIHIDPTLQRKEKKEGGLTHMEQAGSEGHKGTLGMLGSNNGHRASGSWPFRSSGIAVERPKLSLKMHG